MHLTHILRVAAALAILCAGAAEAEQHFVCPPEVQSRQITVAGPAGWRGMFRPESRTLLAAAGVWVGPLEGNPPGELIGEVVKGKKGTTINRFPGLDVMPMDSNGVRMQQEKWMVCTYDAGIVLVKPLPQETKQCEVTYKRVQDPLSPRKKMIDVLSDITCR